MDDGLPQDMVDSLAKLQPEEIRTLCNQLAQATADELAWSPDDFVPIVTQLSALARRAVATGKSMFLWNCV